MSNHLADADRAGGRFPASDTRRDRAYVDVQGDIWIYRDRSWAYVLDNGSRTRWEQWGDLPEDFAPYIELTEGATSALLATIRHA